MLCLRHVQGRKTEKLYVPNELLARLFSGSVDVRPKRIFAGQQMLTFERANIEWIMAPQTPSTTVRQPQHVDLVRACRALSPTRSGNRKKGHKKDLADRLKRTTERHGMFPFFSRLFFRTCRSKMVVQVLPSTRTARRSILSATPTLRVDGQPTANAAVNVSSDRRVVRWALDAW